MTRKLNDKNQERVSLLPPRHLQILISNWKGEKKYSRTSTNGHLATRPHFLVPAESPYIHSYFNLSTTATSTLRQRPLKRVRTVKKTSPQQPGNQLLTNGDYKTTLFCGYWLLASYQYVITCIGK